MTIKKMISTTMVIAMAMVVSTSAQTIENAKPQNLITEEGYILAKEPNISNTVVNANAIFAGTQTAAVGSELVEDLQTEDGAISKVIVDEAKVRREPSPDSDIINFIKKDVPVFVIERIDNWYHIQIEGIDGYIYKEQLDQESLTLIPYIKTEVEEVVEEIEEEVYVGEEVIGYAKQFLGNPYVYGGNSLTKGVDCSGFVQQVFKKFGIQLERSSRSQYASDGYKVSKNDLLPGDLVFYGYDGHIDHVAIYAGNGEIVHASTPKTGITMGELYYGKPIIGIKRVIN